MGVGSADVAVERQISGCAAACDGERDTEDGVGADLGLVVRTVEVQHRLVHQPLLACLIADEFRPELVDHTQYGLADALPSVASVTSRISTASKAPVEHLREQRPALRAVIQDDFDLDGRVAAGIQNFSRADELNARHERRLSDAVPKRRPPSTGEETSGGLSLSAEPR